MDTLIIIGAKYLIYIIAFVAVIVTLLSQRKARANIIKLALFSFPIALILSFIAKLSFYDTRPFVVDNVTPLIPHAANNGFPSDHTVLAMTAATTIFVYNRNPGVLLIVLSILVGVSRAFARVHYPVDIIGGIAIAIVSTFFAWIILRSLNKYLHLPTETPHTP